MAEFDTATSSFSEWLPAYEFKPLRTAFDNEKNASYLHRTKTIFFLLRTRCLKHLKKQQHVQLLCDRVFRPLTKHATDDDSVTEALRTLHFVLRAGRNSLEQRSELPSTDRPIVEYNAVFMTDAARDDIFLPAARNVKSAVPCTFLLDLLSYFAYRVEVHPTYATAMVRDRILIPITQYATTDMAQFKLFSILSNFLSRSVEQRDLFSTKAVRDRILIPIAKFVTTPATANLLFRVLSIIAQTDDVVDGQKTVYGMSPRAAILRTEAVRDNIYLPLGHLVAGEESLRYLLSGLQHLISNERGATVFGTRPMRDRFFIPLAKRVSDDIVAGMFLALLMIIVSIGHVRHFAAKTFFENAILPLAAVASTQENDAVFAGFLYTVGGDPTGEAHANMHTATMRDRVFLPIAPRVANNPRAMVWFGKAFAEASQWSHARGGENVFATESVRDEIIIPMAELAPDASFYALLGITSGGPDADLDTLVRAKNIMATPTVRDEVFCRHALRSFCRGEPSAVHVLDALLSLILHDPEGARSAVFATARVRDEVLVPLFEHMTWSSAMLVEAFGTLLCAFGDTPLHTEYGAVVRAPEHSSAKNDAAQNTQDDVSFKDRVLAKMAAITVTADGAAGLACLIDAVQNASEKCLSETTSEVSEAQEP